MHNGFELIIGQKHRINNIGTPIIVCHFFGILWTIINVLVPTWKYDGVPSKGNTTFTWEKFMILVGICFSKVESCRKW